MLSREPSLAGKVAPYLIKRYGSERVGIIGVTTVDTAVTSSPGDTVTFNDVTRSVTESVAALTALGVNKIIVLSHIGYDEDVKLAHSVAGIDVVVGGHSHTLLGDPAQFAPLGITPVDETLKGPYPTVVNGPGNETALVVQGWRWTEALAALDVDFDAAGRIVSYQGQPRLLPQDIFKQNGVQLQPGSDAYLNVVRKINATSVAHLYDENAEAAARLLPYSQQLTSFKNTVVATATENLARGQNSGPGPLFADAMIWKTGARIAIEQRGGVKTDLAAGNITVGNVMGVLPYGGTVVLMNLTGQQIKDALEDGCDYQISHGWDWFPHVSGMTYAVVNSQTVPKGERIRSLKVRNERREFFGDRLGRDLPGRDQQLSGGGGRRVHRPQEQQSNRHRADRCRRLRRLPPLPGNGRQPHGSAGDRPYRDRRHRRAFCGPAAALPRGGLPALQEGGLRRDITPATKQIKCHAGPDPASSQINSGFRLSPE